MLVVKGESCSVVVGDSPCRGLKCKTCRRCSAGWYSAFSKAWAGYIHYVGSRKPTGSPSPYTLVGSAHLWRGSPKSYETGSDSPGPTVAGKTPEGELDTSCKTSGVEFWTFRLTEFACTTLVLKTHPLKRVKSRVFLRRWFLICVVLKGEVTISCETRK